MFDDYGDPIDLDEFGQALLEALYDANVPG